MVDFCCCFPIIIIIFVNAIGLVVSVTVRATSGASAGRGRVCGGDPRGFTTPGAIAGPVVVVVVVIMLACVVVVMGCRSCSCSSRDGRVRGRRGGELGKSFVDGVALTRDEERDEGTHAAGDGRRVARIWRR